MNYFIKSLLCFINYIFHLTAFAVMFIISRVPILVLIVLFIMQKIDITTLLLIGAASLAGTAYMQGYREGRALTYGVFNTLWRYFLKPITFLIFIDLAYIAIATTVVGSNATDWWILSAILALFMMYLFVRLFYKNPIKDYNTLILRTKYVQYTIGLLWIYTILSPDSTTHTLIAVALIYILEFASYVPLTQKQQSYAGKILLGDSTLERG